MSKKYAIFLITLFCLFLGGFGAALFILPDRDFSDLENRTLTQFTPPKLGENGNIFNGEFMEKFEDYVTDQFPLRDAFVGLKAMSERALGKQENNNVFFGKEDTLLSKFSEPDMEQVEKNIQAVNDFGRNAPVTVYFSLIPSSTAIWSDRLPANAPTLDQKAFIEQLAGEVTDAIYYDTYSTLWDHREEDIYYRTDHHWTTLGAYYGYEALMDNLGMEATPLDSYTPTVVTDQFYGTTFSSSGVRWVAPDTITTYVPEDGITVESNFTGTMEAGRLYAPEYLDKKDKYSYFLGGVQPLCVIRTQNTDAPKLLIVRDSYSDSLAPFLTANFSEIHLIDLRYNKTSIQDYIVENDIDTALVLYSLSNFVSDNNLFLLGR